MKHNPELTPTFIQLDANTGMWNYGLVQVYGPGQENLVLMGRTANLMTAEKVSRNLAVNGFWILQDLAGE